MELTLHRTRGEVTVTLSALLQGKDGVFWLYGGDAPHIGAFCSHSAGTGTQTTLFPGHREEEVVRTFAGRLASAGCLDHILVCAGIHYDKIPKEWIAIVLDLCRELGEEMAARLLEEKEKEG